MREVPLYVTEVPRSCTGNSRLREDDSDATSGTGEQLVEGALAGPGLTRASPMPDPDPLVPSSLAGRGWCLHSLDPLAQRRRTRRKAFQRHVSRTFT